MQKKRDKKLALMALFCLLLGLGLLMLKNEIGGAVLALFGGLALVPYIVEFLEPMENEKNKNRSSK